LPELRQGMADFMKIIMASHWIRLLRFYHLWGQKRVLCIFRWLSNEGDEVFPNGPTYSSVTNFSRCRADILYLTESSMGTWFEARKLDLSRWSWCG
jgi:hypothetical protein